MGQAVNRTYMGWRSRCLPALLAAAVGMATPSTIDAQSVATLERLEIVFWPEYDEPAVLVMLRGWLTADTPLPTVVPLPVPTEARLNAVAKRGPDGTLLLAAHVIEARGTSQIVQIETL